MAAVQSDGEAVLPYGLPAVFPHASPPSSSSLLYAAMLGAPPGRVFGLRVQQQQPVEVTERAGQWDV